MPDGAKFHFAGGGVCGPAQCLRPKARPPTPPPCEAQLRSAGHSQVQLGNERDQDALDAARFYAATFPETIVSRVSRCSGSGEGATSGQSRKCLQVWLHRQRGHGRETEIFVEDRIQLAESLRQFFPFADQVGMDGGIERFSECRFTSSGKRPASQRAVRPSRKLIEPRCPSLDFADLLQRGGFRDLALHHALELPTLELATALWPLRIDGTLGLPPGGAGLEEVILPLFALQLQPERHQGLR